MRVVFSGLKARGVVFVYLKDMIIEKVALKELLFFRGLALQKQGYPYSIKLY